MIEWGITIVFNIEYIMRLVFVRQPRRYAWSALGVIDLLSVLPTYLTLVMGESVAGLIVLRSLRLFRIFRLFQLGPFVRESNSMFRALWASRFKIGVFLGALLIIVTVQGAVLYFFEPDTFENLPQAVYWAIVTVTTVGYGDIAPQTGFGQFVASLLMLMGYGIIAVPTGIVTVEMARDASSHGEKRAKGDAPIDESGGSPKVCFSCRLRESDEEAEYCKFCGSSLQWLDGEVWVDGADGDVVDKPAPSLKDEALEDFLED